MARMEFMAINKYNTTTAVVPPSGTDTAANLFDRNRLKKWTAVSQTGTSVVMSIEFADPVVLSSMMIIGHNLEKYRAFYNSTTASTFSTDILVDSNTSQHSYHTFNSITVSSVQVQLDTPFTTTAVYTMGELIFTERVLQLERNPTSKGYKPITKQTRINHTMADGGIRTFNIARKFSADIPLKFITDTLTSSIEDLYENADPLVFAPFPTTTAWDGAAYEVNITNDFDFKHSENSKTQGQSGKIKIKETPSG